MPEIRLGLIALAMLLAGLAARPALAQLCLSDPISPLCCPSPCPVFDATRVPKLLADAETLAKSVTIGGQIVQSASQMGKSIGGAKASQQLPGFAGILSSEFTTAQTGLPSNPAQALTAIKLSLFEPAGAAASSASQWSSRVSARASAAQEEQVGAFAISLMRSAALPTVPSSQARLADATAGAQQLQGDLAVNSASRLAILQDVGALHQLIAALASHRAIHAALKHPTTAGGSVASEVSNGVESFAAQSSSSVQSAVIAVDQAVGLHDARVAAQSLGSVYPALQQTVASAHLASQFAGDAQGTLQQSLAALGSSASLSDVEQTLLALDGTGWIEQGKTAQAQEAVSKVLSSIVARSAGSSALALPLDQLQSAMAAWLDADKQSRYWAGLGVQAQQSISALDVRLGELSDRAGIDVGGGAAAAQEKALLTTLSKNPDAAPWRALLLAAAQDSSARIVLTQAVVP